MLIDQLTMAQSAKKAPAKQIHIMAPYKSPPFGGG